MTISRRIAQFFVLFCTIPLLIIQTRLYLPPTDVAGLGRIPPGITRNCGFCTARLIAALARRCSNAFPKGSSSAVCCSVARRVGAAVTADTRCARRRLRRRGGLTTAWTPRQRSRRSAPRSIRCSGFSLSAGGRGCARESWRSRRPIGAPERVACVAADCEALSAAFARNAEPFLTSSLEQACSYGF